MSHRGRPRGPRWIALALVATAMVGAVVYADVVPQPPVAVAVGSGLTGGAIGMVELQNTSTTTAVEIDGIDAGTCDTAVKLDNTIAYPFTLMPMGMMIATRSIPFSCASTASYGLHRCQYNVVGPGSVNLASFTAVCGYVTTDPSGTPTSPGYLDPSGSSVAFSGGPPSVGSVVLTNHSMMSFSTIDYQIAGTDAELFKIDAPCNALGCNSTATVLPSGFVMPSLSCNAPDVGPYSAQLYAVAEDGAAVTPPVVLTCTGVAAGGDAALTLTGSPVDAGSVDRAPAGQTSSRPLTMTSAGAGSLTIMSVSVIGGFGAAWSFVPQGLCAGGFPCVLATGTSADLTVTYAPTGFGSQDAQLEIYTSDSSNNPAIVDLDGTGNGTTLSLDTPLGTPPTLDLGTVLVNGSASASFELGNAGDQAATISLTLGGMSTPYSVQPSPVTLNTGDNQVTVTCVPTTEAAFPATLTASGANLYQSPEITINLACAGTNGELLGTPSSLALGEVRSGSMPAPYVFTVSTTSPSAIGVNDPVFMGTMPTAMTVMPMSRNTISAGMPATFMLFVAPTNDEDLTTHIEVTTSSGPAHTIEIPITGHVVHAAASAAAVVNLGTFCVNSVPAPVTAALHASGTGSINVPMAPALAGAPSSFGLTLVSPTMYPASIAGGGSATAMLSTPGQTTAGSATDTLTWYTDVPGELTLTTIVEASYVAGGGGIQPGSLDFGAVPVNSASQQQAVTIKNCGVTPLPIGAITIAPPFTLVPPPDRSIAPSATLTLNVGFTPTMAGTFEQTLSIASTPNPLTVDLRGSTTNGSGSGPGDDDDGISRKSLYACGCAGGRDPSGAIAILVTLLVIVIPRRRGAR